MSELVNLTPFAVACWPSLTSDDQQLTLVVVGGGRCQGSGSLIASRSAELIVPSSAEVIADRPE